MDLFYYLMLLLFPALSESLMCYQCADSTGDGPCRRGAGLHDAFIIYANKTGILKETVGDEVTVPTFNANYKECSPTENTSCIIEEITFNGLTTAYIRDCSDGETFSISVERFNISKPTINNFTTCAYKFNVGVLCITLCGSDVCNGPAYATDCGHAPVTTSLSLIVIVLFFSKLDLL